MADLLPYSTITPIPNTEPAATPSLWNVRYEQIDQNFGRLAELAYLSGVDDLKAAAFMHAQLSSMMMQQHADRKALSVKVEAFKIEAASGAQDIVEAIDALREQVYRNRVEDLQTMAVLQQHLSELMVQRQADQSDLKAQIGEVRMQSASGTEDVADSLESLREQVYLGRVSDLALYAVQTTATTQSFFSSH